MAEISSIPDFTFSGFYYFDILNDLTVYFRRNVPEITDEGDEEPFEQLKRGWALAHHFANVRLDVVANETLLPTARLLESVRSHLKLIGFKLSQATPAQTDVVMEFSQVFTSAALLIAPKGSQFATQEEGDTPSIVYEAVSDQTISRTDRLTYVFTALSAAITLSAKSGNFFDFVSGAVPVAGGLVYQGGNYAIIAEVVDTNTLRLNDGTVFVNGAASLVGVTYGSDKSGQAAGAGVFDFGGAEPAPGDTIYLGHDSVMWDGMGIAVTQIFKTGIVGVWEYYDGTVEDANPAAITNLGSNLRFDLTSLLGAVDRTGTVVVVRLPQTGAEEVLVSKFVSGVNVIDTTGLLGQVSPSVSPNDYTVGSVWAPLDVTDPTLAFSQNGTIAFDLPQTRTEDWAKTTVNGKAGFWLRFRVQALVKSAATVTGTAFSPLGLDANNYKFKVGLDAFADTEIDVTGNAGATPGAYTLASVVTRLNTALTAVSGTLASTASAVAGKLKLTGPDASLGKNSEIRIVAPSAKDATLEILGLSEAGHPRSYLGIGGTPTVDTIDIGAGHQFLILTVAQGETTSENPLGSSPGSQNLEFVLAHRPLIEGSLVVEVDEGTGFTAWSQVENFLNSDQTSRHYSLDIQADDTATVRFGNGVNGKIPPAGVDNVKATYRIGADVDGNVGSDTININRAGISFVNRVFNPRQASGWAPKDGLTQQSLAELKIRGPASIRTLGRGITPADCETLAKEFVSPSTGSKPVARAKAVEETFGVKTIEVIVVGSGGALLSEAQRTEIDEYFNGNKATGVEGVLVSNHEVTTSNYQPRDIDVVATVTGGNLESIKNALKALLTPEAVFSDGVTFRWDFGGEVPTSLIQAAIHETDPRNVKKVVLTSPSANVVLGPRELPRAGNLTITVI